MYTNREYTKYICILVQHMCSNIDICGQYVYTYCIQRQHKKEEAGRPAAISFNFFLKKKEEAGRLLSDLIFCYYDTLTYKDVVSLNSASPGITELNLDLSETKPYLSESKPSTSASTPPCLV